MIYSLLVGGSAFIFALIVGRPVIGFLSARHLGKSISEAGPSTHASKTGTPTMGGLLIFGTVAIITVPTNLTDLVPSFLDEGGARSSILLPLGVVVSAMCIGALDDFGTLVGRSQHGLPWRLKLAFLLVLSLGVALVLFYGLEARSINVPWAGRYEMIGLIYIPIAMVAVIGTTSAVAITDGLDGLLGGTAALAFAAYAVIAFVQGQEFLATFSFTVVGALLGFLWFNSHPASLFMGDTGALPLGASLATVALMTGHWLLLPVIGAVFVAEAASAVIQIAYFQTTGGRRLFRMTPIHHHFELIGWSEPQVVMRMWLIGVSGAMVGVALALSV